MSAGPDDIIVGVTEQLSGAQYTQDPRLGIILDGSASCDGGELPGRRIG
jgi:hypothetical protein